MTSNYTPITITDDIRQSFVPTRLYIKRCHGMWYFGKTTQDPFKYTGSGVVWSDRLKKYGKDSVETLWVSDAYSDPAVLQEVALAFSRENLIVESAQWANLKPENGIDGGFRLTESSHQKRMETRRQNGTVNTNTPESIAKSLATRAQNGTLNVQSDESIARQLETKRKNGTMNVNTAESVAKGIETKKRNGTYGVTNITPESIAKQMETKRLNGTTGKGKPKAVITCPHCGKSGGNSQMKRWHFDNCGSKAL